jgi:phage prohead protease, HK97 family
VETVRLELRDAHPSGRPYRHLEGRAVPYDTWENVGWFLEQHVAGSFERSTKGGSGKNAPLLLFHDNRSWPVGHAESWTHESDGMHGVWRLNATPEAQKAAQMASDGDLTGLSIGFQPIHSKWELVDDWDPEADADHMDRVSRLESRLIEVSITPTPAFQDAQVTLVRHQARYSREARRQVRGETEKDRWLAELGRLKSGV